MADLHNPLFENEKEFLERQKLEYERALLGDVEGIKAKTQEAGKYAAIGAGVLGGIWLLSKAFGGKKKRRLPRPDTNGEYERHRLSHSSGRSPRATMTSTSVDSAVADDLGFGTGHHYSESTRRTGRSQRADIAPDVYHTDADPFQPVNFETNRVKQYPVPAYRPAQPPSEATSILASAVKSFLQSDTGKMLVAQASAVLMAYVAKKASEYLPIIKNPDLASSAQVHTEPETRDIEFTFHDDADAPHQPA